MIQSGWSHQFFLLQSLSTDKWSLEGGGRHSKAILVPLNLLPLLFAYEDFRNAGSFTAFGIKVYAEFGTMVPTVILKGSQQFKIHFLF